MDLLSVRDEKNQRYIFIDILKGIGSLAVVMGHCWPLVIPYVYDFHLALFFWIAGYLYNEKKYNNNPFLYMGHKIERLWPKYVFYLCVIILSRNILSDYGVYDVIEYYSYSRMLESMLYSIIFMNQAGRMAGALWFVSTLILSTAFFAGIIYISKIAHKIIRGVIKETFILLAIIMVAGVMGVVICNHGIKITYHMEVALAILPIMFVGYLARTKRIDINRYLNVFVAILACGVLHYIKTEYGVIDLSASRVYSVFCLYAGAFSGIYVCFYLAKIVMRSKIISKIMKAIGKYSFEIMALHFIIFKLFDVVFGKINNIPKTQYSRCPYAFDSLYYIYIILGVGVPVLVGYIWERLKARLIFYNFN